MSVVSMRNRSGIISPSILASLTDEAGEAIWDQTVVSSVQKMVFYTEADAFPDPLLVYAPSNPTSTLLRFALHSFIPYSLTTPSLLSFFWLTLI